MEKPEESKTSNTGDEIPEPIEASDISVKSESIVVSEQPGSAENQNENPGCSYQSPVGDSAESGPKISKMSQAKNIRIILEAVCVIVLLISLVSYGGLKRNYDSLKKDYKSKSDHYTNALRELNTLDTEYKDYKTKMQPYEEMEVAEAEAKRIEAEKVAAEKKAADDQAAAEKKAAEDQAAAEAAAKAQATASATIEQKNALSTAKNYLNSMSFSYSGLIEQLEFEGYSNEAATFAVDNCSVDWNEQAAKKAKEYLSSMSFSRQSLIDQLQFEGFSAEQAEYGASAAGY